MDTQLRKEMEYKRLGYNAFVTSILTKYLEWDRFAEKFGFVQFSVDIFQQLLDGFDDKMIENIAGKTGGRMKEAVLFYHKRLTLETLLDFIFKALKYSYFGQVQYDVATNAAIQTVSIRHHFGEKWSKLVALQFRDAMKYSLGIGVSYEITSNHVLITFPTNRVSGV
jgi:hypothetical protein